MKWSQQLPQIPGGLRRKSHAFHRAKQGAPRCAWRFDWRHEARDFAKRQAPQSLRTFIERRVKARHAHQPKTMAVRASCTTTTRTLIAFHRFDRTAQFIVRGRCAVFARRTRDAKMRSYGAAFRVSQTLTS
jgi:hypothetical protein